LSPYIEQESPAVADKPVRRENMPKIAPTCYCLLRGRWQYWCIFIRL